MNDSDHVVAMETVTLEPCPFCGDPMQVKHGTLKHIEQGECVIGVHGWDVSFAPKWNRRAALEAVSSIHEAEPVAWVPVDQIGQVHYIEIQTLSDKFESHWAEDGYIFKPLYAHPAPISKGVTERLREALENIRELNMTDVDENGHRWAHSDLIDQEVIAALSCLSHTAGEIE